MLVAKYRCNFENIYFIVFKPYLFVSHDFFSTCYHLFVASCMLLLFTLGHFSFLLAMQVFFFEIISKPCCGLLKNEMKRTIKRHSVVF